jgi:hypothetical protein
MASFKPEKKGKRHTHTQPHQITSISPYASDKTQRKKSLNRCANEKKKDFPFSFYFSPLPSHLTGVYSITRQQHRLNSCPYIVSPLFWFLNDYNWSENINPPGERKEKKGNDGY